MTNKRSALVLIGVVMATALGGLSATAASGDKAERFTLQAHALTAPGPHLTPKVGEETLGLRKVNIAEVASLVTAPGAASLLAVQPRLRDGWEKAAGAGLTEAEVNGLMRDLTRDRIRTRAAGREFGNFTDSAGLLLVFRSSSGQEAPAQPSAGPKDCVMAVVMAAMCLLTGTSPPPIPTVPPVPCVTTSQCPRPAPSGSPEAE